MTVLRQLLLICWIPELGNDLIQIGLINVPTEGKLVNKHEELKVMDYVST